MNVLEIFLQLGTVSLGAFLAFWLENLRERQQLRAWANDYLRRIREDLFTEKDAQASEALETRRFWTTTRLLPLTKITRQVETSGRH